MPTPRTSKDTIQRVYFTRSQALELLCCSEYWLKKQATLMGFKSKTGTTRYSVEEMNRLLAVRKLAQLNEAFDRTGYMRVYMRKYRENGNNKYIRKAPNGAN